MKKQFFLTSALVFSVFLLSACNVKSQENKDKISTSTVDKQVTKNAQSENGIFSGSLKSLLGLGKNQQCIWKNEEGFESTISISGKKYRTDSKSPTKDSDDIHMVTDGEWVYTWQDNLPGTKMKFSDFKTATDGDKNVDEKVTEHNNSEKPHKLDYNKKFSYKCSSWNPKVDSFTPPSDVEFTDVSAMIQDLSKNLKGMCDSFTGDQKTKCEDSLKFMGK